MKIKNLNFLEKHIEKIAIGIGVAFFALVMWLFVIGQPYKVEVVTRMGAKTVTPDQVEVMIRDQARRLESDFKKTELPFERIPLPRWTDDFRERMTHKFLPVDRLDMPMSWKGLDEKIVKYVPTDNVARTVPTPPAATEVIPQADYAVLAAPVDEQAATQLVKLVCNLNEPRDFRYVSVAATFDMEQWRERLKAITTAPGKRIPEDWWRNRLYITNVVLERQTLNPATDQWSQATTIPSLDVEAFARGLTQDGQLKLTAAEVPSLLDGVREAQDRIARPSFVDLERGVWTPPGSKHQLTEEQAQQLAEIQQRLAQLRRRDRATSGGRGTSTPVEPTPAPAVEPTGERNNQTGTDTRRPARVGRNTGGANTLQSQIAQLEAQRDDIMGIVRVDTQNTDPTDAPLNGTGPRDNMRRDNRDPNSRTDIRRQPRETNRWTRDGIAPTPGQDPNNVVPALPPVKIWAHDLTAQPGKIYRYRISVAVLSPLFHINDVPREQYTQFFNKLSITSEPSTWSEPVAVDPERYYFVTAQDAARRQVSIDVFRIFNGIWIRKSFNVRPGDAIGSTIQVTYKDQPETVDLNTSAMLVDITFPSTELSVSSNADQTSAIIYDLVDKTMEARTLGQDLADRTYQRLLSEMQLRKAMANR